MQQLALYITPTLIFPVLLLVALCCFIGYYWYVVLPQRQGGSLEWVAARAGRGRRAPITFAGKCHPMARLDWLLALALTAVYACTAFFQLGSTVNPQSFAGFGQGGSQTVTLSDEIYLTKLMYYTGLGTGDYNVEISTDGESWLTLWTREDEQGNTVYYWAQADGYAPSYAMPQGYADLFKWLVIEPENPQYARYLRISGRSSAQVFELGELALYDEHGLVDTARAQGGGALFDEAEVIPDKPTWYNSTYFDEIYHARTAYEHIRGIYPYEISHPPLGKLILGLGIRMFGMTPFGWRFMGTLLGVAMVPILYVFLKNLFGKTRVALCGSALFAFDFMHLTQTRIATIDTYAVLFILLMYYFMYRYLTLPAGTSFARGAPWLALSGLFWGIGAASKWTVIYGGAGLALLYFIGLYFKIRDWPRSEEQQAPAGEGDLFLAADARTPEKRRSGAAAGPQDSLSRAAGLPWEGELPRLAPWLLKTLAFSVLCFVLVPAVIYTLSYLPYAQAKGDASLSGLIQVMWDNQKYMLNYHKGVHDPHPYESRWYQWVVDGRPILYYLDSTSVPGSKSAFGAFSNPVVCWGGLLALISTAVQLFRRRCGKALFIVVAYFSQLAPWFFITRTTFAYHYFPSILFLVFALSYLMDGLLEREPVRARGAVYALTGTATALYAAFYPVLIGLYVPIWYTSNFLRWFASWPF